VKKRIGWEGGGGWKGGGGGGGRFFRCGRPHFLFAKNLGFFEMYGVSARTKGLSQCEQGGEGSIFRDFVRTSFYVQALSKAA